MFHFRNIRITFFLFFKSPPRLRPHLPDAVGLLASCAVILSPSEFLRTELRLEISHPYGWPEVAQEGVVPSVHSSVSAPVVEHFGVGRCWVATAEVVQLKGNFIIVYIHGKRQKEMHLHYYKIINFNCIHFCWFLWSLLPMNLNPQTNWKWCKILNNAYCYFITS